MENTKKDVQHEKIVKKGARIMIAAPQSGSGKTLITCALLQALKEKNYHLESFKCGPDYIDPMFHKTVLGISSRNLDPFFTEDSITRKLLSKGQDSRDLAHSKTCHPGGRCPYQRHSGGLYPAGKARGTDFAGVGRAAGQPHCPGGAAGN